MLPDINTERNRIDLWDVVPRVVMSLSMPRIVLLDGVLTNEECFMLKAKALGRMERSTVTGVDGQQNYADARRSSSGMFFRRGENDLVMRIEERLARLTGWPVARGEGLQVLRYDGGEEYQPHDDWFDPALFGKQLENGGQRVATMLLYLTDVESGGETIFPRLNLRIAPRKGSMLFFWNIHGAAGTPDHAVHHGGLPVIEGRKVVATKWLRERDTV